MIMPEVAKAIYLARIRGREKAHFCFYTQRNREWIRTELPMQVLRINEGTGNIKEKGEASFLKAYRLLIRVIYTERTKIEQLKELTVLLKLNMILQWLAE